MRSFTMASLLILGIGGCMETTHLAKESASSSAPSGTVTNGESSDIDQGHRASSADQPADQPKNPTDEQITSNIQQQFLNSKMSVNLQNVKVTTTDGKVTLTGLVKTAEEKQKVEDIANSVAGDGNVSSKLEVEQ